MDMEESRHVDATLDIYRRLRDAGIDNVGFVLQAYLYRTPSDLERLLPLGPNLRALQGRVPRAARASPIPRSGTSTAHTRSCSSAASARRRSPAIATHDERMIEHAIGLVSAHSVPAERFQFQMLYGVRPQLQRALVRRGFSVLVATPYGPDWYRYLMRRLAERPANVGFLLRNLVRG